MIVGVVVVDAVVVVVVVVLAVVVDAGHDAELFSSAELRARAVDVEVVDHRSVAVVEAPVRPFERA